MKMETKNIEPIAMGPPNSFLSTWEAKEAEIKGDVVMEPNLVADDFEDDFLMIADDVEDDASLGLMDDEYSTFDTAQCSEIFLDPPVTPPPEEDEDNHLMSSSCFRYAQVTPEYKRDVITMENVSGRMTLAPPKIERCHSNFPTAPQVSPEQKKEMVPVTMDEDDDIKLPKLDELQKEYEVIGRKLSESIWQGEMTRRWLEQQSQAGPYHQPEQVFSRAASFLSGSQATVTPELEVSRRRIWSMLNEQGNQPTRFL